MRSRFAIVLLFVLGCIAATTINDVSLKRTVITTNQTMGVIADGQVMVWNAAAQSWSNTTIMALGTITNLTAYGGVVTNPIQVIMFENATKAGIKILGATNMGDVFRFVDVFGNTNVCISSNGTMMVGFAAPIHLYTNGSMDFAGVLTGNGSGITNGPWLKTLTSTNLSFAFTVNPDGTTNAALTLTNLAGLASTQTNDTSKISNNAGLGTNNILSNLTVTNSDTNHVSATITSGVGNTNHVLDVQSTNHSAQNAITVTPDGKVGFGTNNPQAALDVNGSILGQSFLFEQNTNSGFKYSSVNFQSLYQNGTENFRFNGDTLFLLNGSPTIQLGSITPSTIDRPSAGLVRITTNLSVVGSAGIGTTTPAAKLDVVGGILCVTNVATNGFASFATNIVASANAAGYTNSPVAPGAGTGVNMNVNIIGTSGTYVFYNRSGAGGGTVCGTSLFTNTVLTTGATLPVPVNCGVQIVSGVGVAITCYAQ